MRSHSSSRSMGRYLGDNGPAIGCAKVLSSQLAAHALSGPWQKSIYESSMDIASKAGRPDLGPRVSVDILKSKADMLQLAGYLNDLAVSLPSAASGDFTAYHGTAIYKNSQLVWRFSQSTGILSPADVKAFRQILGEASRWYVQTLASYVQ